MAVKWLRSGWTLTAAGAALLIAVAGCVAYVQREPLLAHWRLRSWLRGESSEARLGWMRDHRSIILPAAAAALTNRDPATCSRAGTLVRVLLDDLADPTDPEKAQLSLVALSKVRDEFPRLIPRARKEAVESAFLLLQIHLRQWSPHVPTVLDSAGAVFTTALSDPDPMVRTATLRRLPNLWPAIALDGSSGPLLREWMLNAYGLAAAMLTDADPAVRASAAVACGSAPFVEFDYQLASLLEDDDQTVRRTVLLALEASKRSRLQGSQKLRVVPFLGDSDATMARAAEHILKQSGVSQDRVELYKLRYSRRADERARSVALAVVLAKNSGVAKVAPFLLELSEDDSPDVRLAFVEAASQLAANPAILGRLRSMSESDPEPRVRTRGRDALGKLRIALRP